MRGWGTRAGKPSGSRGGRKAHAHSPQAAVNLQAAHCLHQSTGQTQSCGRRCPLNQQSKPHLQDAVDEAEVAGVEEAAWLHALCATAGARRHVHAAEERQQGLGQSSALEGGGCRQGRGRRGGCRRRRCRRRRGRRGSAGGRRCRLGCLGSAAAAAGAARAAGAAVVRLRLLLVVGQVVGQVVVAAPAVPATPPSKAVAPAVAAPPAVAPNMLPPPSVAAAPTVWVRVLVVLALLLVHTRGRRLAGCTLSTCVWPVERCCLCRRDHTGSCQGRLGCPRPGGQGGAGSRQWPRLRCTGCRPGAGRCLRCTCCCCCRHRCCCRRCCWSQRRVQQSTRQPDLDDAAEKGWYRRVG